MSLIKNAGFMSVAVLISRFLGLIREQVFAYFFGAGIAADAYLVAFRIPNLFRDMFAEGALSSAFVTVFSKSKTPEASQKLARDVMTVMTVILVFVCGSIFVAAPWIVRYMAADFALVPGKIELTTGLTRLLSPFLFFVSSAALAMGILNSLGSFFMPAMGAAAFNLGNILVGGGLALALARHGVVASIWGFGIGTLVGGLLQWTVQWPGLRRFGFAPWAGVTGALSLGQLKHCFADPDVRKVGKLMAPMIFSVAAVQINVFVDTSFAAGLPQGSVAWMSFAYRIMYFPLGVFGVALSTATLPRLARLIMEGKREVFQKTLRQALNWTQILAYGSTAGLIVFAEPVVSLLYEHGHFHASDTTATAKALMAFSVGLIAFNTNKVFNQAFYAMDSIWVPSLVSLLAIGLNYAGDYYLSQIWGHAGIALATSLASFVNTLVLLGIMQFGKKVHILNGEAVKVFLASMIGCAFIASFRYFKVHLWLLQARVEHGFVFFAAALMATLLAAAIGYVAIVVALTPEGQELFKTRILSRFKSEKSGPL